VLSAYPGSEYSAQFILTRAPSKLNNVDQKRLT